MILDTRLRKSTSCAAALQPMLRLTNRMPNLRMLDRLFPASVRSVADAGQKS